MKFRNRNKRWTIGASALAFPLFVVPLFWFMSKSSTYSSSTPLFSFAPSPSATFCLQPECFQSVGRKLARSYNYRNIPSWCHDETKSNEAPYINTSIWEGLLLVKVPKAASSTMASVVLRIANQTKCKGVEWDHREGRYYAKRDKNKSFLLTSIRHPVSRSLSSVWFFVLSPNNVEPTDGSIIKSLHTKRGGRTKGKGGYQYNYLSPVDLLPHTIWHPTSPTQLQLPHKVIESQVRSLLQSYDFIAVTERMDESLTALSMILGIPLRYVVLASESKKMNTELDGGGARDSEYVLIRHGPKKGMCIKQKQWSQQNISKEVQRHFEHPEWVLINYVDYLLHAAANASLDATIESIGREKFQTQFSEFQRLRKHVLDYCGTRITGTGCTVDGQKNEPEEPCYERDFGCGYQCVDEALEKLP